VAKIFYNPNVYSTCIALLDIRGWTVVIEPGPYEKEDALLDWYTATRDGTTVEAGSPLALLGLASIHEHLHPHGNESYWWAIEPQDPGLYEKLQDDALERSFFTYKNEHPEAWKKYVLSEIQKSVEDPSVTIEDRLGISPAAFAELAEEYPELIKSK